LHQTRHYVRYGFIFAALFCAAAGDVDAQPAPSRSPPPPPQIIIPEGAPPPLADAGLPVTESVPRFIDWAGRSGIGQREAVRKQIASAKGNPAVAQELCREGSEAQKQDHSRALIILSVLGELRDPEGERCLIRFIHLPFPTEGTVIAGEILEQTALGTLQGKAVDGLAYAGTETADREVLWAAGSHPSRIVRAEAINAYLWNKKDSPAARAALLKVVRPDEKDFLDRPRHEQGMSREQFNARLEAYARKHPALKPEVRPARKVPLEASVGDRPAPNLPIREPTAPPQERQ
jgi:hypothetical protein